MFDNTIYLIARNTFSGNTSSSRPGVLFGPGSMAKTAGLPGQSSFYDNKILNNQTQQKDLPGGVDCRTADFVDLDANLICGNTEAHGSQIGGRCRQHQPQQCPP